MREEGARRIYVLWQLERYEIWVCTTGHSTKIACTCPQVTHGSCLYCKVQTYVSTFSCTHDERIHDHDKTLFLLTATML